MQKGLILPLNRITRNVLNQIIKTEREQQEVSDTKKYDEKMTYGKLSKQDLDTIRFLLVKQVSMVNVADIFDITVGTVESIKYGVTHSKKETVFLKRLGDIGSVDYKKLNKWFEQNKEFVLTKIKSSKFDDGYQKLLINKLI